ncbi:hypothetical protein [Rubinisphaera sp. JC750]|uniref:hypothetical protein n=1 Tax=Rubinisphaera sp. JC750 TaxID=2898658 RepID=UPI001F17A817|nr:hypothetical protein [Rubinisphaera sp. JC750]
MTTRFFTLLGLLTISWCVMTFTHEMGHVVAGLCSGGTLETVELRPWRLPYSLFVVDPHPLITLWGGPLIVVVPVAFAITLRMQWMWFIASFCLLANGLYLATGWVSGDRYLDTTKLFEHGASPIAVALYCLVTIGWGYVRFRTACLWVFETPKTTEMETSSS